MCRGMCWNVVYVRGMGYGMYTVCGVCMCVCVHVSMLAFFCCMLSLVLCLLTF